MWRSTRPDRPSPTARKLQQKRAQMLQEEEAAATGPSVSLALDGQALEEEQQEDEPPWAGPSPTGG